MAFSFRDGFSSELPVGRDEFTLYLLRVVLIAQRPNHEPSWKCCELGSCNADDAKSINAIREAISSGATIPRGRRLDLMKDIVSFYVAWPASNQSDAGQPTATEIAIIDPYEPFDTSTYAGCRSINGIDFTLYEAKEFEIFR